MPQIFQVQHINSQTLQTLQQQEVQTIALPVQMERTAEPVWPEDEAAEDELARGGAQAIPFMEDAEADAALRSISVSLPDRLIAAPPQEGQKKDLALAYPLAGCDYFALQVPVSFSAPESMILRRVRLDLVLSSENETVPVAIQMEPPADVGVTVHEIGEVSIDLGKVLAAMLPQMSGMFTARIGSKIEAVRVHPKIQASGLNKHEIRWRVSDSKIAYTFSPALLVQFAAASSITVSAKLHVEVRKRVMGAMYKTYGKNAAPRWYSYHPGRPLMAAYDYMENLARQAAKEVPALRNATGSDALRVLGELAEERGSAEAEKWFALAAGAGSHTGMIKLGMLLEERDPDEAERWYQRAIASGNGPLTMTYIGECHKESDPIKAERWYQMAAEAGDDRAMLLLGRLLEEQDQGEAEEWYKRAARVGNEFAQKDLKRLHPIKYRLLHRPY
jgi:Sel1 repeat